MDNERVVVIDHPMVQHKLSILRDRDTSSKQFRELVRELALFEGYEATRDLPLETVTISTPICDAEAQQIGGKKLAVVPILRAGLGMVDGVLELIPAARVGHLGMFRDPRAPRLLRQAACRHRRAPGARGRPDAGHRRLGRRGRGLPA